MSPFAQPSLSRLEDIVGAAHVATADADLRARSVCGRIPSAVVRPDDSGQIAEVLRYAAAEGLAVIPTGTGTKLQIGSSPSRYDIALDVSRMNHILAYDPQDLTLGVEPGVRIQDLLHTLGQEKQLLPLAVPFLDRATIGGIVASNSSSPLRHAYGSVRDFCLGMEFVTGDGVQAKSGGRVVKNVTGYDLHKLLTGSLGTLAVITRVNFRTFPVLREQAAFVATFSTAEAAFDLCLSLSQSVLTPQVVEVADPSAIPALLPDESSIRVQSQGWCVILSAAGQRAVVERHAREFARLAAEARAAEFLPLHESEAAGMLARIREFPRLLLESTPLAAVFRIGVAPTMMATLLGGLRSLASQAGIEFASLTRASGIVYAAFLPTENAAPSAQTIAEVFRTCSGLNIPASALLEWAPPELKAAAGGIWGPARPDFELMRRLKSAFDPRSVLAPGRFAGGI